MQTELGLSTEERQKQPKQREEDEDEEAGVVCEGSAAASVKDLAVAILQLAQAVDTKYLQAPLSKGEKISLTLTAWT